MPLIMAPQGESMKIVRVAGDPSVSRRLEDLGIVSGAEITLLSHGNGSLIVKVHDSRLALDGHIARSILVSA